MGHELIKHGFQPQETLHCFPLNGRFDSPEIKGVDGILSTYKQNINGIRMAGPTFFSEVLSNWIDLSKKAHALNKVEDLKTYCLLLIITDGTIYDLPESVRLMVEASEYPCSIIIVGVGNGDFS